MIPNFVVGGALRESDESWITDCIWTSTIRFQMVRDPDTYGGVFHSTSWYRAVGQNRSMESVRVETFCGIVTTSSRGSGPGPGLENSTESKTYDPVRGPRGT